MPGVVGLLLLLLCLSAAARARKRRQAEEARSRAMRSFFGGVVPPGGAARSPIAATKNFMARRRAAIGDSTERAPLSPDPQAAMARRRSPRFVAKSSPRFVTHAMPTADLELVMDELPKDSTWGSAGPSNESTTATTWNDPKARNLYSVHI